jgi:putative Ig domain-containing protein
MPIAFPTVQAATAAGPWTSAPNVAFPSPVGYQNIILAAWGNTGVNAGAGDVPPTTVTDSLGNDYELWGQSNWIYANEEAVSQIWVAQGNGTTKYGGIKGGACTVTFNGAIGGAAGGPSLIVCEKEVPDFYQIFGQMMADTFNPHAYFRALANNGSPGGGSSSDTGTQSIVCTPNGAIEEETNDNVCSLILMDQFLSVTQVLVNFNDDFPLNSGPWTSSGRTIGETLQPPNNEHSGTASDASLIMTDQDFPYLGGPLAASCGNPPNGQIGVAYGPMGAGYSLIADGGTAPYTWAIVGGALPPGLALAPSGADAGLISGTPTAAGKFLFTATVTDSVGATATITCSIAICSAGSAGSAGAYAWTG